MRPRRAFRSCWVICWSCLADLGFQLNVAVHAVVGGLASVAGGGKFGNGAVTAAFGYLFNQAMHQSKEGCQSGAQCLDYDEVTSKEEDWRIRWKLSQKSESGGWIIQEVVAQSGAGTQTYWEAWQVNPGKSVSFLAEGNLWPYDDNFGVFRKIDATARFYEGLSLPKTFVVTPPGVSPAGALPHTSENPNLSLSKATPL